VLVKVLGHNVWPLKLLCLASQAPVHVTVSLCRYVTVPLCHCATVSLCHCVTVSMCHRWHLPVPFLLSYFSFFFLGAWWQS